MQLEGRGETCLQQVYAGGNLRFGPALPGVFLSQCASLETTAPIIFILGQKTGRLLSPAA